MGIELGAGVGHWHAAIKEKSEDRDSCGAERRGKDDLPRDFLASEEQTPEFINADLIARGLSPFAPERAAFEAGRIMLTQIEQFVKRSGSFAFETTLSGLAYAQHIRE